MNLVITFKSKQKSISDFMETQTATNIKALVRLAKKFAGKHSISDVQLSPDGQRVVYVGGAKYQSSFNAESKIYCLDLKTKTTRIINGFLSNSYDTSPRWSKKNNMIAFVSHAKNEASDKICVFDLDINETVSEVLLPGRIPRIRNLSSMEWSYHDEKIVFLMEKQKRIGDHHDRLVVTEQKGDFVGCWELNFQTGGLELISPPNIHVWDFSYSQDGKRFAYLTSENSSESEWYGAKIIIIDSVQGFISELKPCGQVSKMEWSSEGNILYIICGINSDRGISGGDIFQVSVDTGCEFKKLTLANDITFVNMYKPKTQEDLFVVGYQKGETILGWANESTGLVEVLVKGQFSVSDDFLPKCSLNDAGNKIALIKEDSNSPSNIYLMNIETKNIDCVTSFNINKAYSSSLKTTLAKWKSSDDREMQGILLSPVDQKKPLPLIVAIHGGPNYLWSHKCYADSWFSILVEYGFCVFLPNPRGSLGWGVEFASANIGDPGGLELQDILSGVDYCVELGLADSEKVGVYGWSYGGYLAAWSITQTGRFFAAVVGAGITNWVSFHGAGNLNSWDKLLMNNEKISTSSNYINRSPVLFSQFIKTPTLLLHGQEDSVVPVTQSLEFHRALKDIGAYTELWIYPGQEHDLDDIFCQADVIERIVNWFSKLL